MDTPAYNAQFYTGEGWAMSYRGSGLAYGQSPRTYLLPSEQTKDKKSWNGLDDPKLTQLFEAAETSSSDQDEGRSMQAVWSYLNENAIDAPLWVSTRFGAASAKLKNFYWFPAPGGGPYEDHPEQWEVTK